MPVKLLSADIILAIDHGPNPCVMISRQAQGSGSADRRYPNQDASVCEVCTCDAS